jgi:adenosine 3'-phospho 5'-phosphosulfate transporter B3
MYKRLPEFNYYWTVAAAELAVFSVMSIAGSAAAGTLGRPRKAPLGLYVAQATVMAFYAAIAKVAYKYLNYATGTVLRSTKLVFTMAISVAWLGRKFSGWDYAAAAMMVAVGPRTYCPPRHRTPSKSRNDGSKCLSRTCRLMSARP